MATASLRRVGLVAGLAALTVGLRLATLLSTAPGLDDGRRALESYLANQGFATTPVRELSGVVAARGDKGYCKATLLKLSPMGWENAIPHQIRTDGDTVAFDYGGDLSYEPPVWETRIGYFADRLRRTLGLRREPIGFYGIVLSSWCRPQDLDLSNLR